jgi:hypothetical protein
MGCRPYRLHRQPYHHFLDLSLQHDFTAVARYLSLSDRMVVPRLDRQACRGLYHVHVPVPAFLTFQILATVRLFFLQPLLPPARLGNTPTTFHDVDSLCPPLLGRLGAAHDWARNGASKHCPHLYQRYRRGTQISIHSEVTPSICVAHGYTRRGGILFRYD